MDKYNRRLATAVLAITAFLVGGTVLFHHLERWDWVDSFYFTGMTLTTVGYGDFTPTSSIAKISAVFFALAGVGIVFYSMGVLAQKYFEREEQRLQKLWESTKGAEGTLPLRHLRTVAAGKVTRVAGRVGKTVSGTMDKALKRDDMDRYLNSRAKR